MELTPREVRRIAELARLELSAGEARRVAAQLSELLTSFASLQEVELPAADATVLLPAPVPLAREAVDEPAACLPREAVQARAPAWHGEWFVVPTPPGLQR